MLSICSNQVTFYDITGKNPSVPQNISGLTSTLTDITYFNGSFTGISS
jgi:hypothetical protein